MLKPIIQVSYKTCSLVSNTCSRMENNDCTMIIDQIIIPQQYKENLIKIKTLQQIY